MTSPSLFVKEIIDQVLRKNFQLLSDYFSSQNQLLNFNFQELNFSGAVTNQQVPHSLGIVPQDIIVTKVTGGGKITFNHGLFTAQNMYVTVDGACRVRFFFGTYWNYTSKVNNQVSDSTQYP